MTNRAPLITAMFLLLPPLLYVGSYVVLVTPNRTILLGPAPFPNGAIVFTGNYRIPDTRLGVLFYPLEQIDRKIRPETWR